MMRKMIAILLALACLLCCFAGCGEAASDVAGSVLAAAKAELENQIKAKIEEYKVTVVETKTAFGKLNGDGKYQFYCAILVQTNTESAAEDCANGLSKVFGNCGYMKQTASEVKSDLLVEKTITYKQTDFSADNYYTVYVYAEDLTKIIDLSKLTTENT